MRISDWSSDVCSSDLISANLDGGCLYVHRGLPIFYHLAGGCIATRYPFPDHLSLAIEGVALDVDPVAEVKRILAARRSEEHTSELQSLMRISYAVFCLKKKQQQ